MTTSTPSRSRPEVREYTVAGLAAALQRSLENAFGRVRVKGEVSGFTRAGSGHLYFDLKDRDAVLSAVCWRSAVSRLGVKPEDGLEVIASGRLTTYPGRSQYQIVVDRMEAAGEGALLKQIEERRKKLAAEGLFDEGRKQFLPDLPEVIGVITSPSGAVLRDILHRLRERFPRHVLLWPVAVQGDGAAADIARAIRGLNRLQPGGAVPRPDLLIVARGGGSVADLLPFSEEAVVRAAAASKIPLISAVGHETDTTLLDFAADVRAPTPTAAAEMAVPVRAELREIVRGLGSRLGLGASRALTQRGEQLTGLARGLRGPRSLLDAATQRFDHAGRRLASASAAALARHRHRFDLATAGLAPGLLARPLDEGARCVRDAGSRASRDLARALAERHRALTALGQLLDVVSHRSVLRRGYAVVRDSAARPVTQARAVRPGMALDIELGDGHVGATAGGRREPARRSAKREPEDQGSLL